MSSNVMIGNVPVGDQHPPVVVAEVGSFFNQDLDMAESYLRQAVSAGAHVFKSEIISDIDDLVLRHSDLKVRFRHGQGETEENYRTFIARKALSAKDYTRLFTACNDVGVPWMATVFGKSGVDMLVDLGGAAIKISRNNVRHVPLLQYAARTGLPVIVDTGEIHLSELMACLDVLRAEGCAFIVNHHPGPNPAPAAIHNMRMIQTYKSMLGVPVGLSCHYRGNELLYVAVALGANLLEKGVDIDPDRAEADLVSATTFKEFADAVTKVRDCWDSLGDGLLKVPAVRNLNTRPGMFARVDLAEGTQLVDEVVGFAWPPLGIGPDHWETVRGRHLRRRVAAGDPIVWDDLLG